MKRTTKKNRDTSRDYVNNKEFYKCILDHFEDVKDCEESGEDMPPIPEYIAVCIMNISENLSKKGNFRNYPFREELVLDGIEEGIRRLYSFNAEKFNNPFAYFTRIIYFCMVRRIQKEKKELYVKHKSIENTLVMGTGADNFTQSDGIAEMSFLDVDNEYMADFVESYEEGMKKKNEKKKVKEEE